MRLLILENYDLASEFAAKYVKKKIRQYKPGPDRLFVLGLPTGSSPLGMYKKLVEFCKNGQLSFEYVATFNMDEYVGMQRRSASAKCGPAHPRFLKIDLISLTGLPRNHPESYHSFMFTNFFRHIDINPANVHILDGSAKDLEFECSEFERKIKELGGIQLFIGGIGPDGHIAFNEPGSSLVSRTRVKTLAVETVQANARFFGNDISKVPKMALTVGVGTVMDAKEVMILITGAHKAYALHRAIEEGVSHMWTVSAFQMHPYVLFVCDEDATLELKVKTVKYFKGMLDHHLKLA